MGNNESARNEYRSHQGMTKPEVLRLLREQERVYQKQIEELKTQTSGASSKDKSANNTERERLEKEVDRLRKLEQEYNQHKKSQSAATTSMAQTLSIERNRSPYSFTRDDLQNNAQGSTSNTHLYPNLHNTNQGANANIPPPQYYGQAQTARPPYIQSQNPQPSYSQTPSPQHLPSPTFLSQNNPFYPLPPNSQPSPTQPMSQSQTSQQFYSPPHPTASFKPPYTPQNKGKNETGDFVFVDKKDTWVLTPKPNAQRFPPSAPPAPVNEPAARPTAHGRDRSKSRPRTNKQNKEENEFNCITCGNKYGLNIFQCDSGHSSCRDCKLKGANCGKCGLPVTGRRNIDLEHYIAEVKLEALVAETERHFQACPNSDEGCNKVLKLADMDNHLKNCPFKEVVCPIRTIFGNCSWQGKLSKMASHFDDAHPTHREGEIDKELHLFNIQNDSQTLHLVTLGSYNFLVHLKVSENERKIYMTVQVLGTKNSASKWSFEIHIFNKSEPRRKYASSHPCHSSSVPLEQIFEEANCVVIPMPYAKNFVNQGKLTYKFFIKRDVETDLSNRGRGHGRGRGRGRGVYTRT